MKYRFNNKGNQHRPKSLVIATARDLRPLNTILWVVPMLVMGFLILFFQGTAWGGEFKIESGPKGIKGYAQKVTLEEVLSYLAEQNGYVVQIDQALLDAPATFYFPMPIPEERAIQRIVHPHSLALVFKRVPGKTEPVITQIKIFDKGKQSASYTTLAANGAYTGHASHTRSGAVQSGIVGGQSVQAGPNAVSKYVKSPVTLTKSSMGFSGFKFKDRRRGPDYRPDPLAMAKAYAAYRTERDAVLEQSEESQVNSAKQNAEQQKNQYRASRILSLQQTINDAKK